MTRDKVFPSKYLKSSDLNGKPVTVTIERATLEKLKALDGKEQEKIVLTFRNAKKALPLNRTNYDSITEIVGDDETDNWIGQRIELFADTIQMAGKIVACVRIRAPVQRDLPRLKATEPPAPPVLQEPDNSLDDEMDDEIPF